MTTPAAAHVASPQDALQAHEEWLSSQGRAGKPIDLSHMDVSALGALLQDQDLSGGRFVGTKFGSVNLRGNLRAADLRNADLSDASLTGPQLAGSNLGGAKLPESLGEFKATDDAAKAIEVAQRFSLALLTAAVFTFLTVLSTSDAQIITGANSLVLPEVSLPVSTLLFFQYGPIVLLVLDIVYQLYLRKVWSIVSLLPSVFPDGRNLIQALPPWFVVDAAIGSEGEGRMRDCSSFLGRIVGWWLTPLAILAIWWGYLPRRDLGWSTFQVGLFAVSCWISLAGRRELLHQTRIRTTVAAAKRLQPLWQLVAIWLVLCSSIVGLSHYLLGKLPWAAGTPIVPIDFYREIISELPANWSGRDDQVSLVRGVNIANRDLRRLNADGAILIGSSIHECVATQSSFREADLRSCILFSVDCEGADLFKAKLGTSTFSVINFSGASIQDADFTHCKFINCTLAKTKGANAIFNGSSMVAVVLNDSELPRCSLDNANLTEAKMIGVKLRSSYLRGTNLLKADLSRADLSGAHLEHAVLKHANLKGTDLTDAVLDQANLSEVNLRGAKGLTRKQIERAITNETTLLPDSL